MELRTPIQRVRLSTTHIVVVLLNEVNLYKFSSPPQKLAVFSTANNPFGLCCLGKQIIAFPGRTPGQVQLVELSTHNVSIIPAHSNSLRALDLSNDGEILATASETGTLIRVWSTANCSKTTEFRRGVDPATIFSIAISPSGSHIAVTSDKSTLHLYDLENPGGATRTGDFVGSPMSPQIRSNPPDFIHESSASRAGIPHNGSHETLPTVEGGEWQICCI